MTEHAEQASASLAAPLETPRDDEPDRDYDNSRPQPTAAFLLPDGAISGQYFGLQVSRAVFAGWATQPSPCCAAASVAGAVNAALGVAFGDGAITAQHVAAILHGMLAEQAAKRAASVARLLGVRSVDPVIAALRSDLAAEGRSLGGRKEKACKGKDASAALRRVIERKAAEAADAAVAAALAAAADGEGSSEEAQEEAQLWAALAGCYPARAAAGGGATTTATVAAAAAVAEPLGEVQPSAADERGDDEEEEDEGGGGCGGDGDGGFGLRVRKEMKTLLSKLGGVEQLAPAQPRLATTFIGNWGISGAVRALSGPAFAAEAEAEEAEAEVVEAQAVDPRLVALRAAAGRAEACSRLRCRALVQLRVKGAPPPQIPVRRGDDAAAVEAAWAALKVAFEKPHTSLLLHQKNHYSLIFALREWTEEDTPPPAAAAEAEAAGDDAAAAATPPRRVRQLLTARKGQRPSAWVDWAETHKYIAGWSGYAILAISADAGA